MSVKQGGKTIAGATQYHPDLFDFKWADHILNDAQWLMANTFSWQYGSMYQAAYANLSAAIAGKTLQSETIAGITVQFYLADDGHKICPASEESNVATIYAATGVAWYYIIDTTNQRFKLPRTQFGFTGIRNGVGKFVEAGLPNITATWCSDNRDGSSFHESATGAVTQSTKSNWSFAGGGAYSTSYKNTLDASDSSSVYGNSDTVQPKATEMYLYFYVGNFTQTALENTAGLNAELFNGKADVSTVAHVVTEFQEPTAENNYTWYRKYADGWVEQGGIATGTNGTITFPITMAGSDYQIMANVKNTSITGSNAVFSLLTNNLTTTSFRFKKTYNNGSATGVAGEDYFWQVSGMAA